MKLPNDSEYSTFKHLDNQCISKRQQLVDHELVQKSKRREVDFDNRVLEQLKNDNKVNHYSHEFLHYDPERIKEKMQSRTKNSIKFMIKRRKNNDPVFQPEKVVMADVVLTKNNLDASAPKEEANLRSRTTLTAEREEKESDFGEHGEWGMHKDLEDSNVYQNLEWKRVSKTSAKTIRPAAVTARSSEAPHW